MIRRMQPRFKAQKQIGAGKFFSLNKCLLVLSLLIAGSRASAAESIQSPKGAEVFGDPQPVIVVPPSKTVRIGWSYPVNFETPDLVFKVYHATNLNLNPRQWALLTNIPGNFRSATLAADQAQEFFLMTASNYLGESDFGTD